MTWTETHRRWQALAEIETLVNASTSDELPWNAEYAEIFGDRDGLVAALTYRLNLNRDTQLDLTLPEHVLEEQCRRLTERNAGIVRVLAQYREASSAIAPVRSAAYRTSDPAERVPA